MLGVTEALLVIVIILITHAFISANKRPRRYPPGPFQLPVLGYIPFINKKAPFKTFKKLTDKYGEAFSLRLGGRNVVYLNSWDLAKEALNHPDVQGRPHFFTLKFIKYGKLRGVVTSEGDLWLEHRRFTLRHLRDFGFGKLSFEGIILKEVEKVKNSFRENGRKPFEISASMNVAIVNIIWKMVADLELDVNDPSFLMLMKNVEKTTETAAGATCLDFFTWLQHIVPENLTGLKELRSMRDSLFQFVEKLIKDHRESFDESFLRDYLDVYLKKMKEDKESKTNDSTFTDLQLYGVMQDLFIAGSETTSTTLKFIFLFLIIHPEIQKKVQQEILNVTKGQREVSLNDKNNLPYTEAFIMEVQRLSNLLPLNVPHRTTATVHVGDYVIPKETIVMTNIRHIHLDPHHWPEPEKLNPTRFLDDEGHVNRKIEAYLPFSHGKRQCLGESLAKAELFLFVANLVQEFTFSSPPGSTPPSPLDATGGVVVHPDPYELIATPLKKD